ncbi:MAG: S8 family serine peptidase [Melioribacteraceae bacterium]|nr:S8 family serine peptidase [Melioribacteraceae bacterium]
MKKNTIIFLFLFFAGLITAQDSSQTFISLNQTGVTEFLKLNPEYDGRGTIIFVLDTGVDMGVEGLTKTSAGGVKVIDAQDFTGQGDIKFYEADVDDEDGKTFYSNEDNNLKISGTLSLQAKDDKYFIGVVKEDLWKNSGSGAKDINANGAEDDSFYFVTFLTEIDAADYWVVFIDTNNNGDLSDEKPLRNYNINYDSFTFEHAKQLPPFTLAMNIFPEEQKISLYFDDGAHGTHCAGIAAGNAIGNDNFYGVAPGAEVIGLKLGNNNYAGGATVTESMKKSFLYFDEYSKKTDKPCIVNMSFGIGSEIEGRAEIEKFLAELTKNNPYIYICTSNGNEGPGISTSGMPAASSSIFSTGAVLTKEVGMDVYGATIDNDIILHFSSRGGEVFKPDVVAPGAAASTVPDYRSSDKMWGTSMASPYSAGVMSLLLSAAKAEFPDIKIPSQLAYRVLRDSAVPIEGYDAIDQGGGYINIMKAYELLKKYIQSGTYKDFETYTISSLSPSMPDHSAPNLYIRDGSYLNGSEKYSFEIKRNYFNSSAKFFRIHNIESNSDWLKPIQKKIHFRNDQSASVDVQFDIEKMKEPGLYNAVITGVRADNTNLPEFDMMATVIMPYHFSVENDYTREWKGEKVNLGEHKRYYVKVPVGATTMKVELSSQKDVYSFAWYFLHNPEGEQSGFGFLNAEMDEGKVENYYYNLEPGVYELVVLGYYRASAPSTYDLRISFDGINRIDEGDITETHNQIKVINNFNKLQTITLESEMLGTVQTHTANLKGYDHHEIPFTLKQGESSKTFDLKLSKDDFNKLTDFAFMIYDEDMKAVSASGLSYQEGSISIRNRYKENKKLKLVLVPGFTNADHEIFVHIDEKTYFETPISVAAKINSRVMATLYPSVIETIDLEVKKPEVELPSDAKIFGNLYFKKAQDKIYELPLYFKF